jgi:hypothetical protein
MLTYFRLVWFRKDNVWQKKGDLQQLMGIQ